MATYVATLNFTDQGLAAFNDSPKRAADFKNEGKKLGIKVTQELWMLGPHDGLLIFDAPDDETATAAMLHLSAKGNMRTQTSRAFSATEMKAVFAKLP